jgi:hypothetical protein
MKKILFALLSSFLIISSCNKEVVTEKNPLDVEKEIQRLVDSSIDPSVPVNDESLEFTEEQIRTIYENQNIWTHDEIKSVIQDKNSTYEQKYSRLASKIPFDRVEDEATLETFCKRSVGYITDSNPNHLAQVLAASGTFVGTKSSLNLFRPINDNGTVTFTDVYVAQLRQPIVAGDQIVEYLPESVVFEYEVSGGNWLIAVDIVRNIGGVISDTTHYCFDCPNGSLIWNPTLSSPANDDVIEGAMPFGVVQISANGLVPPPPIE